MGLACKLHISPAAVLVVGMLSREQPVHLQHQAKVLCDANERQPILTFSGSAAYSWAWRVPSLTVSAVLSMPSWTFSDAPLTLGRCEPACPSADCTASLRPAHDNPPDSRPHSIHCITRLQGQLMRCPLDGLALDGEVCHDVGPFQAAMSQQGAREVHSSLSP